MRVPRLDEGLDPRRQHRLTGPVVREQPAHPAQHLRRAVHAALGRQDLQGARAQLVGETAAAQIQRGVLHRLQDIRRRRLRVVRPAPQTLLKHLLDGDALVPELDQLPLMRAERQVPGLLDGLLAEPPLTHDRPRGAPRQQMAQHPQHIGAARQLRTGRHVQQRPLHTALLEFEIQRREPVVHIARERRQGLVADLSDPVAAHHDLHDAPHVTLGPAPSPSRRR